MLFQLGDVKSIEYVEPDNQDQVFIFLKPDAKKYFVINLKTGIYNDETLTSSQFSESDLKTVKSIIVAFIQLYQDNQIYQPPTVSPKTPRPETPRPGDADFFPFEMHGGCRMRGKKRWFKGGNFRGLSNDNLNGGVKLFPLQQNQITGIFRVPNNDLFVQIQFISGESVLLDRQTGFYLNGNYSESGQLSSKNVAAANQVINDFITQQTQQQENVTNVSKQPAAAASRSQSAPSSFSSFRGGMKQFMRSSVPYPLAQTPSNCLVNAYVNQNEAYRNLNLVLKIGSQSFNGWFEHGGKNWTVDTFQQMRKYNKSNGMPLWDFHAWLEDKDGNVYDTIFETDNNVALLRTGKPLDPSIIGVVTKKSKDVLSRAGVEYVEAPPDASYAILASFQETFKKIDKELESYHAREIANGHTINPVMYIEKYMNMQ